MNGVLAQEPIQARNVKFRYIHVEKEDLALDNIMQAEWRVSGEKGSGENLEEKEF